jgi:hypothetical protein
MHVLDQHTIVTLSLLAQSGEEGLAAWMLDDLFDLNCSVENAGYLSRCKGRKKSAISLSVEAWGRGTE